MARSPRPRALAAGFGVYFLVVAFVAWQFAQGLTIVWYPADLSRWVYTTYMLVAAIFLVGLGGLGLSLGRSFAQQIREIDARLGDGSSGMASESLPPPLPDPMNGPDTVDRDIDEFLESLSEIEATSVRESQAMDVGAQTATPSGASMMDPELAARRERLLRRRKFLGRYLIGPGLVAATVLGLSGLMLPATDVFAQSNYKFNTAIILGIGYSWAGVGIYVAATIYALVSARDDRREK